MIRTVVIWATVTFFGFIAGYQVRDRIEDHRLGALIAAHWSGDVDDMVSKIRVAMARIRGIECKEQ